MQHCEAPVPPHIETEDQGPDYLIHHCRRPQPGGKCAIHMLRHSFAIHLLKPGCRYTGYRGPARTQAYRDRPPAVRPGGHRHPARGHQLARCAAASVGPVHGTSPDWRSATTPGPRARLAAGSPRPLKSSPAPGHVGDRAARGAAMCCAAEPANRPISSTTSGATGIAPRARPARRWLEVRQSEPLPSRIPTSSNVRSPDRRRCGHL